MGKNINVKQVAFSVPISTLQRFNEIAKTLCINKSQYITMAMESLIALHDSGAGEAYGKIFERWFESDKELQEIKRLADIGRDVEAMKKAKRKYRAHDK